MALNSCPDYIYLRQAMVDAQQNRGTGTDLTAMLRDAVKLMDHMYERLGGDLPGQFYHLPDYQLPKVIPGTTDITDGRSFTVPSEPSITIPKV